MEHLRKVVDNQFFFRMSVKKLFESVTPQNVQDIVNDQTKHIMSGDVQGILDFCDASKKWPQKILACHLLREYVRNNKAATQLPDIVQAIIGLVHDARLNVGDVALSTLEDTYRLVIGESDIGPIIPDLVRAVQSSEAVADTIHSLSAVVFVREVDAPMLAILVPLLLRGLRLGQISIKRKCCVISENMCKLVENPEQAHSFLETLLPAIQAVCDNVADPECRSVAGRVVGMLHKLVDTRSAVVINEDEETNVL